MTDTQFAIDAETLEKATKETIIEAYMVMHRHMVQMSALDLAFDDQFDHITTPDEFSIVRNIWRQQHDACKLSGQSSLQELFFGNIAAKLN